ncbi:hypothetical protein [Methanocella conradii]|uniref:hypothetical protein n=1 Tax=Methanocella conradii TaxID=1175444 RepID=UPI0020C5D50A|nr:hypothetical protein [Methanocella conradii]
MNRTLAIVLLDGVPREELIYDEKRNLLDKYDSIIASLQQAGKTRKYLDGASWLHCHSCSSKLDANLNAAYNIAAGGMTVKVRMNMKSRASA